MLGRGVPADVATHLTRLHEQRGVRLRPHVKPERILRSSGRVTGVRTADGDQIAADIVIIGIGVLPRDRLAFSAELTVDDGIIVDAAGRTSHPDVYAAGDVVRMITSAGIPGIRLESWHTAGRQGEVAAAAMLGDEDAAYMDVPWTWSDQYEYVLQSVGVAPAGAESIVCRSIDGDSVLVLSVVGGSLVAACGVAPGSRIAKPIRAAQVSCWSAAERWTSLRLARARMTSVS